MKFYKKIILWKIKFFFEKFKRFDLIIYDDIYPHPVSGFRLEEFTVLLNGISKSRILLSPTAYPIVNTDVSLHPYHVKDIIENNQRLCEFKY